MSLRLAQTGLALSLMLACGCADRAIGDAQQVIIRVEGSDTMVNLAQAWAEKYHAIHPEVSVQVLGGGSGVGIASLIDGNCDVANCSRRMKPEEIEKATAKRGKKPMEHIVGYDAMGIYVHPANPIESISPEELAEVFGAGGTVHQWSQLGVQLPPGVPDKIIRVSRQNSSGTYVYCREHVLGKKRDMALGSLDANGSKDAVTLIGRTPSALGYSGMGYATSEVKMVKVSKHKGEPGVAPNIANAQNGTYPITRPLLMYTVGEPDGPMKAYLAWILSSEGQQLVRQLGYVPAF
jgi:phosphate transport system substrate-binding protein